MQPSLKKNYLYRVFYEILILITPFITTPYISRVLKADGVGEYSFTYSIITYFMLFGALGTASYGAREIARARDNKKQYSKLFWEIELMTVCTTGVCMLVWAALIFFSGKYKYYYLALSPFLLSTMFDISWFFTGLEKIKNIVIRNSAVRILGIILLFLFIKKKEDIILYCLINSCTGLFGNLSMWLYMPGLVERVDFKSLRFKHHFKETLVYFIPTIATSIYTVLDKTLIGVLTDSSYQNGYYEQATKIIKIVKSLVFVAVNSVMTARISYLFAEQKYEEIKNKISKSLDFILFLGIGAIFGLLGISHKFVPTFFGPGFEPVEKLIYLMSPLIIIIGISNCLGSQYYTPSGKRALSAKYIIIGAMVNLVLNICFIPIFKAEGAVIASLAAETVITILYIKNCEGYMELRNILKMIWRRAIAGVVMTIGVYAVGYVDSKDILVLGVQLLCGLCIYAGMLILLKDKLVFQLIGLVMKKFKRSNKI